MNTPITNELQAIRITDTQMEHVSIDGQHTVTALQKGIGCDHFDLVRLDEGIDLYVDDEGAINASPFNLYLTIIAHALGTPAVLFGNGIALSSDPCTGESISLIPEQIRLISTAITTKPDPALVDRLAESLAPMPHIVALLRSL